MGSGAPGAGDREPLVACAFCGNCPKCGHGLPEHMSGGICCAKDCDCDGVRRLAAAPATDREIGPRVRAAFDALDAARVELGKAVGATISRLGGPMDRERLGMLGQLMAQAAKEHPTKHYPGRAGEVEPVTVCATCGYELGSDLEYYDHLADVVLASGRAGEDGR